MLKVEENFSLKPYNSFDIEAHCDRFVEVDSVGDLYSYGLSYLASNNRFLFLGEGSNILFTDNFEGVVFRPQIKDIELIDETDKHVFLEVGAGLNWDDFVSYCVERGYGGIENLSYIPGTVGAAPVQNIGAYGVEVRDVIHFVKTFNVLSDDLKLFDRKACSFSYRYSIFKEPENYGNLVISVVFRLNKKPKLNLSYKVLSEKLKKKRHLQITDVRKAVIDIRKSKLPDPKEIGNAGSFFKNPIVTSDQFKVMRKKYPKLIGFKESRKKVKIPAAWLIDQCGWKGKSMGAAAVFEKQALVLINRGGAKGSEIVNLSEEIQRSVYKKFSISLEPEVKII